MLIYPKAELCKRAAYYLWDGSGTRPFGIRKYLCQAISDAAKDIGMHKEIASQVVSTIERRIYPHITLESWLLWRVPEAEITPERVQAHRLAWLKQLELEFRNEPKG